MKTIIFLLLISINGFGQVVQKVAINKLHLERNLETNRRDSGMIYIPRDTLLSYFGSIVYQANDIYVNDSNGHWRKIPQSKTDTVKGIITYYKYLSKTDIYHHYMLVQLPAIAIYKIDSVFEQYTEGTYLVLLSRWRKTRELLKILVNNKPFDLSKHYEFLRDDEIVK